jgi:hypothetical protein
MAALQLTPRHRRQLRQAGASVGLAIVLVPLFWVLYQLESLDADSGSGFLPDARRRRIVSRLSPVDSDGGGRRCRPGDDLPVLVSVHEWRSRKVVPREAVTLVTQLSADRIFMLQNQCLTWPDPIVAVVHVPLARDPDGGPPWVPLYRNSTLQDLLRSAGAFHRFMEGLASCALHLRLVGQFIDPLDPEPYPINALRNVALERVRTEALLLLDVDFVASPGLGLPGKGYRDPAVYDEMMALTNGGGALVLPALEMRNRQHDLALMQDFARSLVLGEELLSLLLL